MTNTVKVTTKYLGATDTRGSRIKAVEAGTRKQLTLGFDYAAIDPHETVIHAMYPQAVSIERTGETEHGHVYTVTTLGAGVKQEFDADICSDCLMSDAGISEHERGESYSTEFPPLSHLVEAGESFTISQHTGEDGETEDSFFSNADCDGCGERLAGTRHSVTVTVWA